jgi:hypothetical protein
MDTKNTKTIENLINMINYGDDDSIQFNPEAETEEEEDLDLIREKSHPRITHIIHNKVK